ncbi:P-loop containing nucleoside triphosphate hydrolase protein [Jackrogersella minutella]|nr:P-loop containing nucleoside triphosphate hydrolase protein [Jackrogersella minutella]
MSSQTASDTKKPKSQDQNNRSQRLDVFFYKVLDGKWKIQKLDDAQKFLEAIVNRTDKPDCIERLATSKSAQDALHESLSFNASATLINTFVSKVLQFLADPALKRVGDGELLKQILWVMVDPPLFWNSLVQHIREKQLDAQAVEGFAWLLSQLVLLPPSQSSTFRQTAESLLQDDNLTKSGSLVATGLFQKIRALIQHSQAGADTNFSSDFSPGGRHDNDFVNYHDIAILPTCAELQSTERPFYLQASAAFERGNKDHSDRAFDHLDNQFRLLREDMLGEIREDLNSMKSESRKHSKKNLVIKNLTLDSLDEEAMSNDRPCTLVFKSSYDILGLGSANTQRRKKELQKTPSFLRHQSFGCLMKDDTLLAFVKLSRNEDKLALLPPCICLQIIVSDQPDQLVEVLSTLRKGTVDFLMASTPIFAYEPILQRLQRKTDIELGHDILVHSQDQTKSTIQPTAIIEALETSLTANSNLQGLLETSRPINLDPSQVKALIYGLTYQTCQIQGPPGTGKSLVGALLAKILLDFTTETILVLSYTNHALDQFIEDMLDIGIGGAEIVRLGSKSTARTQPLTLSEQKDKSFKPSNPRYESISAYRSKLDTLAGSVSRGFEDYSQKKVPNMELLEYLEFSETENRFYDAFSVPEAENGEVRVGKKGKKMKPDYLLFCWITGKRPGAVKKPDSTYDDIWRMPKKDRQEKVRQWEQEIRKEKTSVFAKRYAEFNKTQETYWSLQKWRTEECLRRKRIICCTTTAASIQAQEIEAATPGIIIAEEAGEILEAHIIAAMGPSTKQIIQIGDHKQLRPKVKSYKLTVASGHGYDLNRSLFERLILQGKSHCTLLNQHRMRPEISALIRHNYPDLEDAQGTKGRPHLQGFQHNVVFFNHDYPEAKINQLVDKLDQGAALSKQNTFEAEMVLKCVRYLGQQNYKTANIVVLTPYLGQLQLLRNKLSRDHDPILNDLDSHDLVEAGKLPEASAKLNKQQIRLSTIDNYQGEESDIVIVSLTRSNEDGDIGFMAEPERVNVLISRARDALIMIGSANTFMNAKKGRDEWTRLFNHLKADGKIYDGLPLKCMKHPETKCIVRSAEDFDIYCPDGGCTLPCNEMLSCGRHTCEKRCHTRVDHSNMPCYHLLDDLCPQKHKRVWPCSEKNPPACQVCRREKEVRDAKARRDKELEQKRQARQLAYTKRLRVVQDEIDAERKAAQDAQEERTRERTLQQLYIELKQLKQQARKPVSSNSNPAKIMLRVQPPTEDTPVSNTTDDNSASEADQESHQIPTPKGPSSAELDWQHQKTYENASNKALDSLFQMIGLESVKKEFLSIKARIDTSIRQGADIKDERLGAALLGNPGTGKTTVARLYGQFLSSVGAIPGDHFEETTGSRLANDGVQGCKDLIDEILNQGGGVFFLDEAYQIVSSSSMGGAMVLDFLLAEIENLRGKVVFVFAGYRKQMEAFFAHNPGIPSRIPLQFDFQDYEDDELLKILNFQLGKKFNDRMKVEGGPWGLYMRIVARRIGRGRGREGFGNAREVENVLSILHGRQVNRLRQERQQGHVPDDLLLQKIDLVGPEPSKEFSQNKDWQKLQSMIGLKSVKQSVTVLVDRLQTNYGREMEEKPLVECSLNKVFIGNPGTGKTTVAKLYGKILKALGLLSNGEVIIKNPSDFLGAVLGQSEKNTKAILDSTKGKVLIIDEAYMLASGASDSGGGGDMYRAAVVDTIVAEVQSTALEDRCVLLLGYKEQMEDMFQKVNPGLTRRFPISSGFTFDDYDDGELRQILELKLKQQGFRAGEAAKKVVLEVLRRARNRPNFGNAGEVDIILDQAKERQQRRLSELTRHKNVDLLVPEDIDPDFDRGDRAATNIRMLFQGVVGGEDIVEQLEGYQQIVQNMKSMDMDPCSQLPFAFLFRGPPGTGKTVTARKMGKIYYDMGFLGEAAVVDCSATDLVGQYVGQTGPKVQKKFEEALGKVLFIDEAYRLAEGVFAKEAMDEIVDCLTKERYQNKLVVILAGYDNDINRLMNQNPGLTSRFPETLSFRSLLPHHCRDLLLQCIQKKNLNIEALEASLTLDTKLLDLFDTLTQTKSWANARDVQTLAKSIFSKIMKSKTPDPNRIVSEDLVIEAVNAMLQERTERGNIVEPDPFPNWPLPPQLQAVFQQPPPPPPPQVSTSTETATATEEKQEEPPKDKDGPEKPPARQASTRDAGVSDAVWEQLQRDRQAFEQRQREAAASRARAAELEREVREQEEALKRQQDEAARREQLLKLEAARVQHELAERARREQEERLRKEQAVQAKLQRSGRCPVGFEWIPQDGGYRCAGGSHFVANGQLGL